MIAFANPEWLLLLLMLPLLAWWKSRKTSVASVHYSSVHVLKQVVGNKKISAIFWLSTLRLFMFALVIVALARPQLGRKMNEIESSGIDLVLALDISGSMETPDFTMNGRAVSRFEAARAVVSQFIEDRSNDRIGMIAFGGRPYMVSPLTLDHDWLLQNLERVRIGMVEDGTAIGSAIVSSVNRLRDQKAKSKLIILLTDGANNAGKVSPMTAADAARAMGIKIYTIGAGSDGRLGIPLLNSLGIPNMMMARADFDEKLLKQIAETTGGQYFRATDTESLRNIYKEIDQMEKTTHKTKRFESHRELYPFALMPSLVLLLLELVLSLTTWRRLP